jgi:hypothetical protein
MVREGVSAAAIDEMCMPETAVRVKRQVPKLQGYQNVDGKVLGACGCGARLDTVVD